MTLKKKPFENIVYKQQNKLDPTPKDSISSDVKIKQFKCTSDIRLYIQCSLILIYNYRPSADPDIFLRGGPTENALVLLYDTLISGFQWM